MLRAKTNIPKSEGTRVRFSGSDNLSLQPPKSTKNIFGCKTKRNINEKIVKSIQI